MKIYFSYLKDVDFDKVNGWTSNLGKLILFWNIVPCNSNLTDLRIEISNDITFKQFDSIPININDWNNRVGLSYSYKIDYSDWENSTKFFRISANDTYSDILKIQFNEPINLLTVTDLLNILPGNRYYNKELDSNIGLFYDAYTNEFNDVKLENNLIKNQFLFGFWDLTKLNLTNLNSYDILLLNHYLYINRNKLGSGGALTEFGHFLTGMDATYKFKKDEPYIIIGDDSHIYYRLDEGIEGTNPLLNLPLESTNSLRRSIYVIFNDPKNILTNLNDIKDYLINLLQDVVGCAFYFQLKVVVSSGYTLWKNINNCKRKLIGLSFKTNDLFYQYIDPTSNQPNTLVKYNLDDNTYQIITSSIIDFGEANWFTEDDINYYFSNINPNAEPYINFTFNLAFNKTTKIFSSQEVASVKNFKVFPIATLDDISTVYYSTTWVNPSTLESSLSKDSNALFFGQLDPNYSNNSISFQDRFNDLGIYVCSDIDNIRYYRIYQVFLPNLIGSLWMDLAGSVSSNNGIYVKLAYGKLFMVVSQNSTDSIEVYDFNTKQLINSIDINGYTSFHNRKVISDTDTVGSKYLLFGDTTKPRVMFVNMQTLEVIYKDYTNQIPYQNYSFSRISYSYVKNNLIIFLDKTDSADSGDIKCWFIRNMNIE